MKKHNLNLLEIHGTETNFGGASNGTKILFDELTKKGENVFLCHSKNNQVLINTEIKNNKLFINFTTKNPLRFIMNIFKIYYFIKKNRINVVHTHHRNDTIYACILKLLVTELKIHYTVHGPSVASSPNSLFYFVLHKWFLLLSNHLVDNIIYISNFTKDIVQNSFSKLKSAKVIYNGTPVPSINKSVLEIRNNIEVNMDSFVVSIIGGIEGYKRPDLVIEIAEMIKDNKDIFFVFIGDGNEKNKIKNLISQKHLTNIKFVSVTRYIGNYINASDLVISTAIGEGFGRTIIEAMSLKKPVISFNNGGPMEIIVNNYNGFLINNMCIKTFSNSILRLYNDEKLAKLMGSNGSELYLKKFSSDIYTKNYLKEFQHA